MNNQSSALKLGHRNVKYLFTSFDKFIDLVVSDNDDEMCVTENWINDDQTATVVQIPGLKFIHMDRVRRGGGVGIYIRQHIPSKQLFDDFVPPDRSRYKISLCIVYRAPSSSVVLFVDYLDSVLSFIASQYDYICLLGDINVGFMHDLT
ncbi:unnamed protein product [Acanthoscelides obtectus]|uniref:Endonuclease/exonuclease/phosphatase domain-containing protein n=1 Tax=Acanthoscelides obtectus TaxID=200917 RepID=A0A9P0K9J8_ACAOB|nr:unnamed protein product [Acanthoscelides obtectus]CAK1633461.1 hypothetical protein AOBTE_LOCUS8154 [Acanthoscelides obtectus]